MAVTLTGTSSGAQGLFNRLGAIGYRLVNVLNAARLGFDTDVAAAMALHDGASAALRGTIANLPAARLIAQSSLSSFASAYRTAAEQTLIEMFDADAPLPKRDREHALRALLKQMRTATTSYFDANSVTATPTQTSLTGNGNTVVSVKDGLGYNLENLLAERILLTCSGDTTSGSESIRVRTEEAIDDKLSHLWPRGSGIDKTITSVDAGASDNLLTGGDFNTFTVANAPDGWTLQAGAAGTDFFSEASIVFKGAKSLRVLGDGSTLPQFKQTLTGLLPHTPYAYNFWARNSTNPAAGAIAVDFYDGSSVINNEKGDASSVAHSVTTLGTSFVPLSGVLMLPDPVPATVQFRVRWTTANTNTHSTYIDHMSLTPMTKVSTSQPGATPWVSVFSGSTDWSLDDGKLEFPNVWKIETTNDRASAWQELLNRLFDTADLDLTFPSSGTTLIDDALIA